MIDRPLPQGTIALIWVADRPVAGPGLHLATAAAAGLTVSEIRILDATPNAEDSLALRRSLASDGVGVIRLRAGHGLGELCHVALQATAAPILFFCDAATPLEREALRRGFDQILEEAVDGWLGAGLGTTIGDGPLPKNFRGALLRRSAVAAVAAECDRNGDHQGTVLAGIPRLTTEPALAGPGTPEAAELPRSGCAVSNGAGYFKSAFALLSRRFRGACPTFLLVGHGLGGGTTRYQRLLGNLVEDHANVLYAWGDHERRLLLSARAPDLPEVAIDLPCGLDVAARLLRALDIRHVDVLHTIGLDTHIEELLDRLGVSHDLSLMDYHHFATAAHLLDDHGVFIGERALADSRHPMRRQGPRRRLITEAQRLIACSRDLAARLARLAPDLAFLPAYIPDPSTRWLNVVRPYPIRNGEPFRVVFMGRFDRLKGSATVVEVARLCRARGLPIEFHVLGELVDAISARDQAALPLFPYGRFREEQVDGLLGEIRPHVAWFPFAAPETYSFTLSDAIAHHLPIVTVALGAVAERLEGRPYTWVLKAGDANPEAWTDLIEQLCREKLTTPARGTQTADLPPLAEDFYERFYLHDVIRRFHADRGDVPTAGTADPSRGEIGTDRGITILLPSAVPRAWSPPTLSDAGDEPAASDPRSRGGRPLVPKTHPLIEKIRAGWEQMFPIGLLGRYWFSRPIRFRFVINSHDLRTHDAYSVDGRNILRGDDAIEYSSERDPGIGQPILFFGPYISLVPAAYLLTFGGRIEGRLALEFTHNTGRAILKRCFVDDFRDPIYLAIDRPVTNFEIRGGKTGSLKRLRIETITVDRIRFAGKPS